MLIRNNWIGLTKDSPVSLKDIAHLGRNIKQRLHSIKNGRGDVNNILELREGMNVLIRRLLSLLHNEDILQSKADMEIFLRLQQNFGRLLNLLDEKEADITSMIANGKFKIQLDTKTLRYITELESILDGDIFLPLERSLERKPKNSREMLYHIYEMLSVNMGVFGSESRVKGKTSKSFDSIDPGFSAKTNLSKEGQKKLSEEFVDKFKGFQDLKIADGVFDV